MKHILVGKTAKPLRNIMTKILCIFTSVFSSRFSAHALVFVTCIVFISFSADATEITRGGVKATGPGKAEIIVGGVL